MSEPATEAIQKRKRPSMSTMIFAGLLAGAFVGLFIGEYAERFKWVGDAYVGLLQMAVLPYVAISLVTNVGRLSADSGVRILRASLLVMVVLWGIALLTLAIMSQSFPKWNTGSFFSSQFTEEPPAPNWMDLFIPSNPFRSLTENAIPAVVVFSIGIGVAMLTLPNKEKLLEPLEVFVEALSNLNRLVVKLTPIGMFAIAAHTAGTIDFDQFQLIQGYLLTHSASAILLSIFILPAAVSTGTDLRYRDVLRAARDPLVTAFVIGNTFVVLPMIIDAVQCLMKRSELDEVADSHQAEYLIPLAYPFPDVGRIAGLIFIPFAAWFYGTVIDPKTLPALLGVGFLGSFAKPVITMPFLLKIAELPSDIFNLFLAAGIVAARFGDLMKTMHLISFTILVSSILRGTARFRPGKLAVCLIFSIVVLGATATAIRVYLHSGFSNHYSKDELITEREMLFPENRSVGEVNVTVLKSSSPNPVPIAEGLTRIERIKQSKKLRVGFCPDRLPFSYYRSDGKLVGFDIQMAYYLADDLGVELEFVPCDPDNLEQHLAQDHFDVAMSAMEGTMQQAASYLASKPYMEVTLAIVIPDHEKARFADIDSILKIPNLKLATVKGGFFADRARRVLPANVEYVELNSATEYFDGRYEDYSGIVISAETGSAWTLRRPEFSVANPLKGRVRIPLYYLTMDPTFDNLIQNWLTLKRSDGTYQDLYDYWILGLETTEKKPRWCIMRDVLGWVP